MAYIDRCGYTVLGPEEFAHFSYFRSDVLDVFGVKNIKLVLQIYTTTTPSSDHNSVNYNAKEKQSSKARKKKLVPGNMQVAARITNQVKRRLGLGMNGENGEDVEGRKSPIHERWHFLNCNSFLTEDRNTGKKAPRTTSLAEILEVIKTMRATWNIQ